TFQGRSPEQPSHDSPYSAPREGRSGFRPPRGSGDDTSEAAGSRFYLARWAPETVRIDRFRRARTWRTASRSFTLIELLVGLAIFSAAVALANGLLFGGSRAYGRARARLDVISPARAVLEQFQSDVRRSVGGLEVSDNGAELTLRVLSLDAAGLPHAGADGRFAQTEICYRFDASTRRLTRDGQVLARDLPDVAFTQSVQEVGGAPVPAVTATITAILDDRPFGLEATAVPRLVAGWATCPGWVFTTLGAPYDFKADR
ncbi:MAG: type II secretion system protein, partial [Candidatus Riflebacteria bacterium]|nr:type II secretion system protein [Candidatus Riflebacteria bacterium]